MTVESVGTCEESGYGLYSDALEDNTEERTDRLRELRNYLAIENSFSTPAIVRPVCVNTGKKVAKMTTDIQLMALGVGGGGKITVEWGGNEEPKITGNLSVEVKDEKGRQFEIGYTRDNEGRNKIDVGGDAPPTNLNEKKKQ